jgi:hypothetical protein
LHDRRQRLDDDGWPLPKPLAQQKRSLDRASRRP